MKKLLLLSALAMGALLTQAQTITVTYNDGEKELPVENGATVTSYYYEPFLFQFAQVLKLDPELVATVSSDANLAVTITNTSTNFPNLPIQFCWPSGCESVALGKSLTHSANVKGGEKQALAIDGTINRDTTDPLFDPKNKYELSAQVEIVANGNPATKFSFNVNMIYDPEHDAAVEGVIADEAPAVYYDLNGRVVANPENGIFICKQGGKTLKVVK